MTRSETARLPVLMAHRSELEVPCDTPFSAQLLAQGGARRGLRGGEPVLRGARSAYLSTQWRGPDDRRPSAGRLTRLSA